MALFLRALGGGGVCCCRAFFAHNMARIVFSVLQIKPYRVRCTVRAPPYLRFKALRFRYVIRDNYELPKAKPKVPRIHVRASSFLVRMRSRSYIIGYIQLQSYLEHRLGMTRAWGMSGPVRIQEQNSDRVAGTRIAARFPREPGRFTKELGRARREVTVERDRYSR